MLADNKELIPEFYLGEGNFLRNLNQVELGLNHLEEKVGDVGLPGWAKHEGLVMKLREALESNHVSSTLNKWIDLVFGYLQRGEKAVTAFNVFQPTTYEDNIDWNSIPSKLERQSLQAQICNFGQCPSWLNFPETFSSQPHP